MIGNTTSTQQPRNQHDSEVSLIETMTAKISHDLSNPMMIFNNVLEIIKNKNYDCSSHELKKYVEMLETSSFRLNARVRTLAYFNSQRLHIKNESILRIIRKVVSDLKIPASVKITLPENDAKIEMDVSQIETMMIELISNVLQVLSSKGSIIIRLTENSKDIVLEIENVGDGIPLESLPKLFDPTFLNRKTGSCLGLPACKRIIENHDGRISVDTNPFGMVFTLKLLKKINVPLNLIPRSSRIPPEEAN